MWSFSSLFLNGSVVLRCRYHPSLSLSPSSFTHPPATHSPSPLYQTYILLSAIQSTMFCFDEYICCCPLFTCSDFVWYVSSHFTPLPPPTSHLSPLTSHLPPPTSHLPPPTSHLSPLTSHLPPPTSHLHLSPLASHLPLLRLLIACRYCRTLFIPTWYHFSSFVYSRYTSSYLFLLATSSF